MRAPNLLDPTRVLTALDRNRSVIVVAPPGSGKSTLLCAEIAKTHGRTVVCQPRRVAARSLAAFVSAMSGSPLGTYVGYAVRFDTFTSALTQLTYVTTGVLLRALSSDPSLSNTSVVVLDEFHERALEMDVVLALVRKLQQTTRPDLKLVVMSATLGVERLANFLGNAAVVDYGSVFSQTTPKGERVFNGRFPVDVVYLPSRDLVEALDLIEQHELESGESKKGAVLIFQPGKAEIESCIAQVRARWADAEVIPLHSELPDEEQDKIFAPAEEGKRKVIVATNIAETSITVPDVLYVIDSGLEKVSYYNPKTHSSQLVLEPISRSSATQRAGRAGRVAPGMVIRLWSKEDHARMPLDRRPEITRQDLSTVLLALKDLGFDADKLEFLDQASPEQLKRATRTLRLLDAIDDEGRITPLGREIARLPLEPRLGRAILALKEIGSQDEALPLLIRAVSMLSARSAFVSLPKEHSEYPQMMHAHSQLKLKFARFRSDLITNAAILSMYEQDPTLAQTCYLRTKALEEALQIENQISSLLGLKQPLPPPESWELSLTSSVRYSLFKGYPDSTFISDRQIVWRSRRKYFPIVGFDEDAPKESYVVDRESPLYLSPPASLIAAGVRTVHELNILNNVSEVDIGWLSQMPNVQLRYVLDYQEWHLAKQMEIKLLIAPPRARRSLFRQPSFYSIVHTITLSHPEEIARALVSVIREEARSIEHAASRNGVDVEVVRSLCQYLSRQHAERAEESIVAVLKACPALKNNLWDILRSISSIGRVDKQGQINLSLDTVSSAPSAKSRAL